jgi:hypothetical protein
MLPSFDKGDNATNLTQEVPRMAADNSCEIGIDCPPGDPRPGDLFPKVLRGTGLRKSDFEDPLMLMGAWLWILKASSEKQAIFLVKRSILKRRLMRLLNRGIIRGAVLEPWGPQLAWNNERQD